MSSNRRNSRTSAPSSANERAPKRQRTASVGAHGGGRADIDAVGEQRSDDEGGEIKQDIEPLPADFRDRRALITGITGQDGSYLAEFLLEKGYEVHGIIRRASCFNTQRIDHIYRDRHDDAARLFLHYGDLTDSTNLMEIMTRVRPHECYNLGAMSHVKVSFEMSEYTAEADGVGTLRLLNAIRSAGLSKTCRLYQASTSELYGKVREVPQRETTPFYPRSPYAVAKQFAFWMLVNYREAYGMHLTNGILFNHESPRRGPTFVTRKITRAVARIAKGLQDTLYLGNIDSQRDWGHARDYIEGMWLMVQQDDADDYVLSTGEMHTVREFVQCAFAKVGKTIQWRGQRGSVDEIGVDASNPDRVLVRIDPKYFRPTEVEQLLGDSTRARTQLGWSPKITFRGLVEDMMEADIAKVEAGDFSG